MQFASPSGPAASPGGGAAHQPLFGIVASGRPVLTNFQRVQEHQYIGTLEQPAVIPDLSFFLLPAFEVYANQGFGASLHFSTDGTNWEYLGALGAEKPSDIFRTGWATNISLRSCQVLQIGVSIEPLQSLVQMEGGARPVADRLEVAKSIARNLFHFFESFDKKSIDGGNYLVLPSNALDKWLNRFERKYRCDPNFFMDKKS
jgi:hypothetical protein|eukprot:g6743.t1